MKTSLIERVGNYIFFYGMPQDRMIPVHPDDFADKVVRKEIEKELDIKLYPLGMKEEVK